MACEHQPIIDGGNNPCLCCPPIPTQATLDKIIAVGFGSATATRDGEFIADGENDIILRNGLQEHTEDFITFADIEQLAVADPDHDWRVELHGPLHGETYQRQGDGVWVCIERNQGFA